MLNWSENYNWTHKDFENVVVHALEVVKTPSVTIDVEHSSRKNIDDICSWAKERGYNTEVNELSEYIKIIKSEGANPKQLYVYGINYNPLKKEDEVEVTQISIPAKNEEEARARLKEMVGGVMAKKFFLNDVRDY